jgi:hypothetical protein
MAALDLDDAVLDRATAAAPLKLAREFLEFSFIEGDARNVPRRPPISHRARTRLRLALRLEPGITCLTQVAIRIRGDDRGSSFTALTVPARHAPAYTRTAGTEPQQHQAAGQRLRPASAGDNCAPTFTSTRVGPVISGLRPSDEHSLRWRARASNRDAGPEP